jgi:transcriptional regulator with XRE-family HTH domain
MLTLRIFMRLTQAELAELLGISRYAISDWELGNKYPKVRHLKQFIVLALERKAFAVGHEAEEIRALWDWHTRKLCLMNTGSLPY